MGPIQQTCHSSNKEVKQYKYTLSLAGMSWYYEHNTDNEYNAENNMDEVSRNAFYETRETLELKGK